MHIGVPREIKDHEFRVGVTPAGVRALSAAGHSVLVQTEAGSKIGFSDADYQAAGATIAVDAAAVYGQPLVVKVKEPQSSEVAYLKPGQILFCYLHLAAEPALSQALLAAQITGVAYETVSDGRGGLPLLIPMSELAGRIAAHVGANCLHMANGGAGVLLGGVPGVAPGKVLVVGAGTVGTQAAKIALGLGAEVTITDIDLTRLRYLDDVFGPRLKTRYSDGPSLAELSREADVLIGSVSIPGKRAPKLISRAMVKNMKRGAVIVDVAIDQGGSVETSRPTTHSAPTYIEEGVVHYCVTNMPAACSRTATEALTQASLPLLQILARDPMAALRDHPGLGAGLQVYRGQITHAGLAQDLNLPYSVPQLSE